jgi:GT2 family glycosyltransferase
MCQQLPPQEIIVCIDHNEELLSLAESRFSGGRMPGDIPITVVGNRYEGRLGSARNTGAEIAEGQILVFLDDDARADPAWLARLVEPYAAEDVVAVGGAPIPEMARPRPGWLPREFDWVFGCSYAGLPTSLAPVRRLIGASMSVRREALEKIGGFQSDNHDDMDMCHRLASGFPHHRILYQPAAVVYHHVPRERLTWHYFWRRCFLVNRSKVLAFREMRDAASLAAEREFARRLLTRGVGRELSAATSGDLAAVLRIAVMATGMLIAGAGYLVGTIENEQRRSRSSLGGNRAKL